MKRFFLILCLTILNSSAVFASGKVLMGIVLDGNSQSPIEYASVLILDKDSTYLVGCVSGEDGTFEIKEMPDNAAILKISFVGYQDVICDLKEISLNIKKEFTLHPVAVALKEISVVANRKPFTIKDERIVFDPSFVAYAINANDIVRQAPGVMDTGNSLIMPGKDAIKVYINDKEQKGSLDDILLLLKSYTASDVASVEVMTNPSTRYTMGRNVGVINIKLKKKPNDYFGGNAAYSFAYDTKASNEGGLGLFYQGKRLSTSLNVAGNLKEYDIREKNTVGFSDYSRHALTNITRDADDIVLRWNLNYQINDNWNTGLSAYYANGRMKQKSDQKYIHAYNDGSEGEELIDGKRVDKSEIYFASFDLNGKLSKKSNLTLNVDYYHKDSPTERNLESSVDETLIVNSLNDIRSDNLTAKVNVSVAASQKFNMNFGVDGIFTYNESKDKGVYGDGLTGNDKFSYNENEVDLYGEARYKFNPKWMLRGSVRYQSIWTETKAFGGNKESRHFDVICPAAFLSYLFKDNQSVQLGFYYNINKPTLTALSPTELYIGNDTYRIGNPDLENSRHYVVNLSYSLGSLMIQPYIEWLDNGITEISWLKDNRTQVMTWENAVNRRNIGMMIFYSYSKPKWMRASATAFLSNPRTTSEHPLLQQEVSSFKFSINPNLQFYFDKERKWTLSVFGNYTTPEHTVDIKLESMWKLSASLTWKPDKRWTLSATGQDLLHSHTRGVQYIGDSEMTFDNKYMYTGFQLSVSYSWGKSVRRTMDRAVLRDMNVRTELD